MPGCWDYSIMENASFADSFINLRCRLSCYRTPETLRQLFILCVVEAAGLPDVAFPLCSNLCWVKHWRTGENSSSPETFKHFVHSCTRSYTVSTHLSVWFCLYCDQPRHRHSGIHHHPLPPPRLDGAWTPQCLRVERCLVQSPP